MIAVKGGMQLTLCFLANFDLSALRLRSFLLRLGSLAVASWSSIRAPAISAQHRRNRSLSDGRFASFLRAVVVVTVVVAMLALSSESRLCSSQMPPSLSNKPQVKDDVGRVE